MSRNIKLGYAYTILFHTFFWYGPWLLYFTGFLTFTEVAILMAVLMFFNIISEIPTGAFTDLYGKKIAFIMASVLTAIGEIMTGLTEDFLILCVAWAIMGVGYSFFSGTMEAFMFDSLQEEGKEDEFPQVLSRLMAIRAFSIATSSILGGFTYRFLPNSIFYLTGFGKILSLFTVFSMKEPIVVVVEDFGEAFRNQMFTGVRHIFSKDLIRISLLILTGGVFATIAWEIVDDTLVLEYGYNEIEIGILYA